MVDFDIALKLTLQNEGGYSNNPKDKGGETYAGISRNFNPTWIGWRIIDNLKLKWKTTRRIDEFLATDKTIIEAVKIFYKKNYWLKNNLEKLISQDMANLVFDFCVNSGGAILRIQKFLLIEADGICGNETIEALNKFYKTKGNEAINDLVFLRLSYVKSLADFDTFGAGWENRIKRYLVS